MKYQFYLPEGYSTKDLIAMHKLLEKRGKIIRFLTPPLRLAMICLGIYLIVNSYSLGSGGYVDNISESPAFVRLVGLIWIGLSVLYYHLKAWGSRRAMMQHLGAITVTVNEDGVSERTQQGGTNQHYEDFVDACVFQDRWFLFQTPYHACILPKSALTEGDPEQFEAFWAEMTGKPVTHMK